MLWKTSRSSDKHKTKTYRKIYEELDKKFVSQVIENIYKYCEFDFNTYVNSKEVHDRPKNIEKISTN